MLIYKYPWIWMDTGGWCNWWDGKEIGFLHDVCSYRQEWYGKPLEVDTKIIEPQD